PVQFTPGPTAPPPGPPVSVGLAVPVLVGEAAGDFVVGDGEGEVVFGLAVPVPVLVAVPVGGFKVNVGKLLPVGTFGMVGAVLPGCCGLPGPGPSVATAPGAPVDGALVAAPAKTATPTTATAGMASATTLLRMRRLCMTPPPLCCSRSAMGAR